jgi:hypothetical protein
MEAEVVEHVIREALRGGLAVLGPEDVVLAVNERRVYRLILEEDLPMPQVKSKLFTVK